MLSEKSETQRLLIVESSKDQCTELQMICDNWNDKELMEGEAFEKDYILRCLTEGDLPPVANASKDFYKLMSVHIKETSEIIGFFDMYHGFPARDTVWISIFVIDRTFRNKGFAQEVIGFVSQQSLKKGYGKLGIKVYLKNWRALRFWTQAGFNRVSGISGDKEYSQHSFARIGLEKILLPH